MSRGAGKMQDYVLLWLGDGATCTIADIHSSLLDHWEFEGCGAKNHSRSLRNSLARAIRGLAKAGKIQQTPAGEWWIPGAAKELEKERREELLDSLSRGGTCRCQPRQGHSGGSLSNPETATPGW